MSETLLEMAKALVLAQIEAQHVTPDNLRMTLHNTYDALYQLRDMEIEENHSQDMGLQRRAPVPYASDWKESITKRAIKCLECGDSFKQLSRRHLQKHDLEPQSYRLKYGIPPKQSLAAREATARRRQLAKSIRPWESARVANLGAKRSNGMARKQTSS